MVTVRLPGASTSMRGRACDTGQPRPGVDKAGSNWGVCRHEDASGICFLLAVILLAPMLVGRGRNLRPHATTANSPPHGVKKVPFPQTYKVSFSKGANGTFSVPRWQTKPSQWLWTRRAPIMRATPLTAQACFPRRSLRDEKYYSDA